ncbi:ImmA/IrrE family metallo-endopeptidase [Stenomitos frigidus]|uniref:ImmA/IrrE family metallo-endopeptidase n=1 Tax=Stenomitos frigidus TaxID=1886765 RepID=UPI0015E712A7|nr:ImmA/IrrE family metallo-endopeptidase [Stenomitos frigidus]
MQSLLSDDQPVQVKLLPDTKFKYHLQQQADIPDTSHRLASRVAELVAYGVKTPFVTISKDVNQVRSEILQDHPQINLESILNYCWKHGVAVVYFNDYPENTRKITGMIQWQCDRPVIVLSSKKTYPAWLAFHLAHELAHLALGHIKAGILIDDEIDQNSDDGEETAANLFAVKLLVNDLDNCFDGQEVTSGKKHLKNKINKRLQADSTVDPCALAFNYAWHTGNYKFANKAVDELNPAQNGHQIINQFLENHIDWESLTDDNSDHLDKILGD